jgi:hypothetical protein
MLCCKTISTPMDPNVSLQEDQGKELDDVTIYRQLVKSLIYLTLTWPDISYPVGVVSRYMNNQNKPHLDAIRRIHSMLKALSILVFYTRRQRIARWWDTIAPTTLEIVAHDDQPRDTSSVSDQEPYHYAVKDNLLWHCLVLKQSIGQRQWQHKRAPSLSNWWSIFMK